MAPAEAELMLRSELAKNTHAANVVVFEVILSENITNLKKYGR
jgi:hypothetical protein